MSQKGTSGGGAVARASSASTEKASAAGSSPFPANYTSPTHAPEPGKAPLMQARLVNGEAGKPRTWALIFGKGDEVMSGLTDWAGREDVRGGHLEAIGAMSSALFGSFDMDMRAYLNVPVSEQVECVSLNGDIGQVNGKPAFHIHGCVACRDKTMRGEHLLSTIAWPTLEVFVTETAMPLMKHEDPETTLELFDLTS